MYDYIVIENLKTEKMEIKSVLCMNSHVKYTGWPKTVAKNTISLY